MKKAFQYILAVCREEVDNDDLFLAVGTAVLFYGISRINLDLAIIVLGCIFLFLSYIVALPPKHIQAPEGEA